MKKTPGWVLICPRNPEVNHFPTTEEWVFCQMGEPKLMVNVVGCGRAARTLLRHWAKADLVQVAGVCNRSLVSAQEAVSFIGQGRAVEKFADLAPADLLLIGVPDREIAAVTQKLAAAGVITSGMIVFHLSGALPSDVLEPARTLGAVVASLHPVLSFADPARAADSLPGCWCTVEGDPPARHVLCKLMEATGVRVLLLEGSQKTLYHAALVMLCNYLVVLVQSGLEILASAGITRDTAVPLIRPLVEETLRNCWQLGTSAALTGPIARGDTPIVEAELAALQLCSLELTELYRHLGRLALRLARSQGQLSQNQIDELARVLAARSSS